MKLAARVGGVPVEEADPQREQQRKREEDHEAEQVGRQEGEPAQRFLGAGLGAEVLGGRTRPHQSGGERSSERERQCPECERSRDAVAERGDQSGRVGLDDEPHAGQRRQAPACLAKVARADGGRAVGQQLTGDQYPQQPDADHEERDECLVQALTEIADRLDRR